MRKHERWPNEMGDARWGMEGKRGCIGVGSGVEDDGGGNCCDYWWDWMGV